ncbi:hypothetical protein AQ436_03750 [Arthrobacter sp. EpRS66]|nr:hypothetical protein AQ436_03750 [Arthrobacter sp. EpRS66]
MADSPYTSSIENDEELDREVVEKERTQLRKFISTLSPDDIKSGGWFAKLCAQSLKTYTEKTNAEYFREKYTGVPASAVVDQRIKLASRYAAVEGALSAGAYTATVAATIGSLGGASPATVPAAIATLMVDVTFITQLQLRLAYDIAVLYKVPLDITDPEDMWKLIRVAFTVKSGELAREGVNKFVPVMLRPLIKKFYSGSVLNAAKGLPFVGKYLLQRNIIKIGLPLIGIPLAVILNRYTTLVAGRHAESVFRNEARIVELTRRLCEQSKHPQLLLWVSWLVIMADDKVSDDEALLIRYLVRFVRDHHGISDERFADVVVLDPAMVWNLIGNEMGDLEDILGAATIVANVDGPLTANEKSTIAELRYRIANSHSQE